MSEGAFRQKVFVRDEYNPLDVTLMVIGFHAQHIVAPKMQTTSAEPTHSVILLDNSRAVRMCGRSAG
jgi:hypothetical protein